VPEIARAAAVLGGATAWPSDGGEPVFAAPWEGRAFAMALDVVERAGVPWEEFRRRLVAAIDDDPQRPYYESWVVALERLVLETAAVTTEAIARARNHAAAYRYHEAGVGDIEVFPVQPDEDTLRAMLAAMFQGPWRAQVRLGIHGAVTAFPGHAGRGWSLVPWRSCRHAELYRTWLGGAPTSWGFRMFDGDDDQQLDVLLPNPFLDDDDQVLPTPDWSRLACWDELRRRFLALGPDPADRLGTAFSHG
jgi:nitrile hydratase accessory protein